MSVLKYFKNTPQSPPHRATGLKCKKKFSKSQWGPWKKKALSPPSTGDRGLSPTPRATRACRPPLGRQGPVAHWGRQAPPFFFSRDFVANLKKKNYILGLPPYGRATGVYFWNISKRTYIFEILIFFKYKKEKTTPPRPSIYCRPGLSLSVVDGPTTS